MSDRHPAVAAGGSSFHLLDGTGCQCGGYISSSFAFSAVVIGKTPSLNLGRHGTPSPHINDAASSLWPNPMTCPNSWETTKRATTGNIRRFFGKLGIATRTFRTAGKEDVNGLNPSPSDRAMITSPFASLMLFRRERVATDGVAMYARRSSVEIILRLCDVVPKRNALPSWESSSFQKSIASRTAGTRESSWADKMTILGVSFHVSR